MSVWVRELSCSAKQSACMAALCHEAACVCPLWVACCQALFRVYFLCVRMPLVVRARTRVCRVWVRQVGTPSFLAAASAACGRGWGGCLCWLRARARQAQHAPVRAPRLQPSARSGFRCLCLLPRAAACSKLGPLSAGPLALRQEDEFEEDAWAREYRDGCGPGGNRARAEDGLRANNPPCGWLRALIWYLHPDPDRDSGQPLPQPTPEGRKEGKESACERGSPSRARAATSSLGNRCHSNGVALPSNATAGWRRPLPHYGRGCGGGCTVERASLLWPVWVCLSTSRVGGEGERLRGHEPAPTWLQSSQ